MINGRKRFAWRRVDLNTIELNEIELKMAHQESLKLVVTGAVIVADAGRDKFPYLAPSFLITVLNSTPTTHISVSVLYTVCLIWITACND